MKKTFLLSFFFSLFLFSQELSAQCYDDAGLCVEKSTDASQGTFSEGYTVNFTTSGSTVTATFKLLDSDKVGVIAYIWKESPFSESQMTNTTGNEFTASLSNQSSESVISYACKFAFAGGLSATKYFSYRVGSIFCESECGAVGVSGCTDATAFNYDASATVDDGSCVDVALGCTDATALNYDALANTNDDSCIAVVLGCTDATASNYDISANRDDGSCTAVVEGCTDLNASNYNQNATLESVDDYGNIKCVYAHCDDIPKPGCIYTIDGVFTPFIEGIFGESDCISYGGYPCEGASGKSTVLNLNFEHQQVEFVGGSNELNSPGFDGGVGAVVENPHKEGINTSDRVGRIVRDGGATWAGSRIPLDNPFDFTTSEGISFKVFTAAPVGTEILLKLEDVNYANNGYSISTGATTTRSNEWEELHFTFSQSSATAFDHLVFMFDFGKVGDGSENSTFYFDDICLITKQNLLQLDLPVDFDDDQFDYTTTDFGGNESSLVSDPEDENNKVIKVIKPRGAASWAGTTIGTDDGFANNIPLTTSNSIMTVRVWAERAGIPVMLKVENSNNAPQNCETVTNTTSRGWQVMTFDFTNERTGTQALDVGLANGSTFNKASLFFNYGRDGNEETFYFDNVRVVGQVEVYGCTDNSYLEYNSIANTNNGTCLSPVIYGCTDVNYLEFNINSNTSDGSCENMIINGCTDPSACNFNSNAHENDGSCIYPGQEAFYNFIKDTYQLNNLEQGTNLYNQGTSLFSMGSNVFFQGSSIFTHGSSTNIFLQGSSIFTQGTQLLFYGSHYLLQLIEESIDVIFSKYDSEATDCSQNTAHQNFGNGIFLPDGEGISFETSINITGFDPATTISLADSIEVCVDIEHSYLGDLEMSLFSPNNKEVILIEQIETLGMIGWFLGDPIDHDNILTVGECWEYCWSLDPEFGIIGNELDNITTELNYSSGNQDYKSLIPGSYTPSGNLQDFAGSPANGTWTLKITDNLAEDNGFICGWNLFIASDSKIEGCMDENAINYNQNATVNNGSCHYSCSVPENWNVKLTGTNMTIMVPGDIGVNVLGSQVQTGSAIGVFYEDNFGALKCGGYSYINESTTHIAVVGDDITTNEIDGFVSGDQFIWKIWDAETCSEFPAHATYSAGSNSFATDELTFLSSVNHSCQSIEFPEGWFMFSSYMELENKDVASVFHSITEDVIIVKNNAGEVYLPEWNYNGFGNLINGQGYTIKLSQNHILEFCGTYLRSESNPINLTDGWNTIAYLSTHNMNVEFVMSPLTSRNNLVIVKDYQGNPFLPEWDYNGIGEMKPGQGYQLKVNNQDQIYYPTNELMDPKRTSNMVEEEIVFFPKATLTGNNMHVVIPAEAWEISPEPNAEIAAYDANGQLVGSSRYNPNSVITIWGDDQTTQYKDGLNNKNSFIFKLWENKTLQNLEVLDWELGDNTFEANEIHVASKVKLSKPKSGVAVLGSHPNPAKDETNICFLTTDQQQVSLKIYSILGHLLEEMKNENYKSGHHQIPVDLSSYPPGTYFYTLEVGGHKTTEKLIITK